MRKAFLAVMAVCALTGVLVAEDVVERPFVITDTQVIPEYPPAALAAARRPRRVAASAHAAHAGPLARRRNPRTPSARRRRLDGHMAVHRCPTQTRTGPRSERDTRGSARCRP